MKTLRAQACAIRPLPPHVSQCASSTMRIRTTPAPAQRQHLRDLEERFRILITINADAAMGGQTPFMIERGEQVHSAEQARAIAAAQPAAPAVIEPDEDEAIFAEEHDETEVEPEAETAEGTVERMVSRQEM